MTRPALIIVVSAAAMTLATPAVGRTVLVAWPRYLHFLYSFADALVWLATIILALAAIIILFRRPGVGFFFAPGAVLVGLELRSLRNGGIGSWFEVERLVAAFLEEAPRWADGTLQPVSTEALEWLDSSIITLNRWTAAFWMIGLALIVIVNALVFAFSIRPRRPRTLEALFAQAAGEQRWPSDVELESYLRDAIETRSEASLQRLAQENRGYARRVESETRRLKENRRGNGVGADNGRVATGGMRHE